MNIAAIFFHGWHACTVHDASYCQNVDEGETQSIRASTRVKRASVNEVRLDCKGVVRKWLRSVYTSQLSLQRYSPPCHPRLSFQLYQTTVGVAVQK